VQETLNDALAHAIRAWPAKTFLRIDGAEVSFETFDRDVGRLAAGLRSAGVQRGDHVVVFMRNSLACLHTWFATNRLGAVWAPVNTELRGLTLAHVCELASASVFIADEELVEPLRRALGDRGLHPRLIVHGAGDDRLDDVYADEPIAPEPVTLATAPRCCSPPARPGARRRASSRIATSSSRRASWCATSSCAMTTSCTARSRSSTPMPRH
jgi:acyl-CoA synthetase (AMP-forming)/AMP-acid ligase II